MRSLAVEQLRKTENDALEVNFASFSLCYTGELFFCHAWLIHVTFEQIQSRVYMSPCRGGAFLITLNNFEYVNHGH
jgi:hypothetical protein